MTYIHPSTQSLAVCFQSRYSLPDFQREYKWESSKHFAEFLNDVQMAFLDQYDPAHGRRQVADYNPYFLGSIITAREVRGKKPLIDGQQRLTSAFLVLAYLHRYCRDHNIRDAMDLHPYLGNRIYGEMDYCIEFSPTRKAIFDLYLDFNLSVSEALQRAEEIEGIDDGDRRIIDALSAMDSLITSEVRQAIPFFIDFVMQRVLIIDISVSQESEAHRIFVTMNDRGLRLGPIDLLKGHILSKIQNPRESHDCHSEWVGMINKLRAIDPEEDSLFFRNLLRAKWAETMRGKAKGDPAQDFEVIGEAYHRWFTDNLARIGISNADDYVRFTKRDLPRYADAYVFIKKAEDTLQEGYEWIYYNAARKYSLQPMVLLAAVDVNDTESQWKRKITLAARLIDLILTSRAIEGKENNYDNLKELSFALARNIRNKSYEELLSYVRDEWRKYYPAISNVAELRYSKSNRMDILYVLARIACYLENSLELTNRVGFEVYWARDRGHRTFDIEHLLKAQFDPAALPDNHGFSDPRDYSNSRDLLGALALLPRSRNRSLQDRAYREKLRSYATENVLTQTLCEGFYENNPKVAEFLTAHPSIQLEPIADFTKAHIALRGQMYTEIAKEIWKCP